jgi:hypothetical protein
MKKAVLALVTVSAVGYGVYRWRAPAPHVSAQHDKSLVQDRLWIDHIPRNDRDTIQIFAAITEEPMGVFQAASMWKGQFEFFRYEMNGEDLRVVFPQDGGREKVRAKATRCDKNGMDFCLELEGSSRGVKKYYSREGWEIGSRHDIEELTAKIVH